MKTNYENRPLLDIIFEHRNKAYGAYALRTGYDATIRQALFTTIAAVALLLTVKYLRDRQHHHAQLLEHLVVAEPIAPVHLPEQPKPVVPQAAPPTPPQSQATNTIRHTEMRVTENNNLVDSLPNTEQLQLADAGLTTNFNGNPLGISDGTGTEPVFIEPTPAPVPSAPVRICEVMPQFPGGDRALMKFLADHTEFPMRERELGIGGKVISEFTVNEDGRVSDIKILKSPSGGFDKEVVKVVKMLPAFKPGMQQGKAVKVRYVLPFTFNVSDY